MQKNHGLHVPPHRGLASLASIAAFPQQEES